MFFHVLSEFATIIMFDGNFLGKTQSFAPYVFVKVEEDETQMAIAVSVFSSCCFLVIVIILSVGRRISNACKAYGTKTFLPATNFEFASEIKILHLWRENWLRKPA